jgi:hypothetical protein
MVLGDILMADTDLKPWVANTIEKAQDLQSHYTLIQFVQEVERYYDTTNMDRHLPANRKSHALLRKTGR